MNKLFYITFISVLFFSCHSKEGGYVDDLEVVVNDESLEMEMPKASSQVQDGREAIEGQDKKVIKSGRLSLKVGNLERVKQYTDSVLQVYEGYYSNENLQNTDYETTYSLIIRIPNQNFEGFVAAVEAGQGEVLSKSINARDVTEEYLDLEGRLSNKRAYVKRYKELLQRANTIKEILEIEEKIRPLEEEIESVEGRLKYLSNQVAYSTLNLTLIKKKEQKFKPAERTSFFERLKEALASGWYMFVDFLLVLLRLWPFWIVVVAFVWLWKKFKKKKVNP